MLRLHPTIVVELRTARAWGVPLSTVRRGRKKWTLRDRMLALALTVFEDGLCPACGQPRDRAWNEDMEGWYTAHRARCMACHAKELDDDHRPLGKSEYAWVSDDSPPDLVPDERMSYLREASDGQP